MATYTCDNNPNTYAGTADDDIIAGAGGNDTLSGGDGMDDISGDDSVRFRAAAGQMCLCMSRLLSLARATQTASPISLAPMT